MKTSKLIAFLASITLVLFTFVLTTSAATTSENVWLKEAPPLNDYAYSMAVLGDIQNLTDNYPDKLPVLFDWIKNNKKDKKIEFCIGLGDLTNHNSPQEYELVNQCYSKLKGKVPFSIIRGNHDRSGTHDQSAHVFNTYISKVSYKDQITGSYDNTMLNTYRIIKIGEVKYLFLNLDFLLKDEVLVWANKIVSENKDCHVIVSTHIYFAPDGVFLTLDHIKIANVENGAQGLWDKLLKKHENIVMLICGHCPSDTITVIKKRGLNDNMVTQILVDPQQTDLDHGGTGMVAMFYFSEDGKELQIRYYSTIKEMYFMKENQLSVKLDIPKPPSEQETTESEGLQSTDSSPVDKNENSKDNKTVVFITAGVVLSAIALIGASFWIHKKKI